MSCGGEGEGNGAQGGGAPAEPKANLVEVGLTEYAFDMPDEVVGGTVTFEAVNTGDLPHEMGFAALPENRTIDDVMKALRTGQPPDWTKDLAGIPVVSPEITTSMTRDLDEGQYVFWCFLPTPEGESHASEGMVKVFSVRGRSEAEPPQPDLTITATDEGFQVPEITAGKHTIELVNDGTKPHEFAFVSFEPGKGERDLGRWFGSGYETPAPAVFPGGLQAIEPGTSVLVEIKFESGRTYTLEDFPNELRTQIKVE
ncbi:MAG: cupredoxin domain-containing protein [Actinomycetota bacterium]|nr:cupredoxin domain-containing protein [Actinomycetota bacterium]